MRERCDDDWMSPKNFGVRPFGSTGSSTYLVFRFFGSFFCLDDSLFKLRKLQREMIFMQNYCFETRIFIERWKHSEKRNLAKAHRIRQNEKQDENPTNSFWLIHKPVRKSVIVHFHVLQENRIFIEFRSTCDEWISRRFIFIFIFTTIPIEVVNQNCDIFSHLDGAVASWRGMILVVLD